jgi:NAD-dependent histone deacetylase SIR2
VASRSPSLPADYPSPPSSNSSESGSSKKRDAPERTPDSDASPAKKQKIVKPKELKTEHLDLRAFDDSSDDTIENQKLEKLMRVLRLKRKIVVIAGAGISVSAGSMSSSNPRYLILLTAFQSPISAPPQVSFLLYALSIS